MGSSVNLTQPGKEPVSFKVSQQKLSKLNAKRKKANKKSKTRPEHESLWAIAKGMPYT